MKALHKKVSFEKKLSLYQICSELIFTLLTLLTEYINLSISDNKHEISGSNARLTLIRLWAFIAKQREKVDNDTHVTRRVQRLLQNLVHIQHLAYSTELERTRKNILAMNNMTSYVFALDYMKVSVISCLFFWVSDQSKACRSKFLFDNTNITYFTQINGRHYQL